MSRSFVVKASTSTIEHRVVQASRSAEDMLDAFEARLAELNGVESSTEVEACDDKPIAANENLNAGQAARAVEVYDRDWNSKYEDRGGAFDADGAILTLGEIKEYWNDNNLDDPILAEYPDFQSWWIDTRDNFLEEYED